jgi:hypothetical protein
MNNNIKILVSNYDNNKFQCIIFFFSNKMYNNFNKYMCIIFNIIIIKYLILILVKVF